MLKRDLYYEGIPTKSQRDDARYLGDILGRVIRKQEGQNFFNLVEKIRLLSKANVKNINNKMYKWAAQKILGAPSASFWLEKKLIW